MCSLLSSKAARSARFALRIATDFEPHHVRKNPVATTAYILRAPESIALLFQSTVFVQLTLGHLCLEGEGVFSSLLPWLLASRLSLLTPHSPSSQSPCHLSLAPAHSPIVR